MPEEPLLWLSAAPVHFLQLPRLFLWFSGPSQLFHVSSFSECCPFKSLMQSKVNRLFNLFPSCQETLSCEITEQELRLCSRFENSHRTSPLRWQQPQPLYWWRPLGTPEYIHGHKWVNQAWPYRKTASLSQERLLKAQLMLWPCSCYCEGCVATIWKCSGDHSRTIMSPPGSLLLRPRGEKVAGLTALGHHSPNGHFSVFLLIPSASLSIRVAHYFISDRFAVFLLTFSNTRGCSHHPPQSSDQRLQWFE